MAVGRDLFIADLRIETCGKFILYLRYRKSMDNVRYGADFHHNFEKSGISAIWLDRHLSVFARLWKFGLHPCDIRERILFRLLLLCLIPGII
jgi:hypothetical protein